MKRTHTIDAMLNRSDLVVCVGPGGVGKTTTAAAIAAHSARQGMRTLVITIDPAKRLADALGLKELSNQAQQVPGEPNLAAAMLDIKESFDDLIRRVSTPQEVNSILNNRVYRSVSKTLARSHAYVAMERLYDAFVGGSWDRIVLDTPPTRSALEILDAPSRLVRFLDGDVVNRFTNTSGFGWGKAVASKLLAAIVGKELVHELIEFFSVIAKLREGFQLRATEIIRILARPETAFLLIAGQTEISQSDALALGREIKDRDQAIRALLFNRALSLEPISGDPIAPPEAQTPSTIATLRHRLRSGNENASRNAREFLQRFGKGESRPDAFLLPSVQFASSGKSLGDRFQILVSIVERAWELSEASEAFKNAGAVSGS